MADTTAVYTIRDKQTGEVYDIRGPAGLQGPDLQRHLGAAVQLHKEKNLPPAEESVEPGTFKGDPAQAQRLVMGIANPQERANALRSLQDQLAASGGTLPQHPAADGVTAPPGPAPTPAPHVPKNGTSPFMESANNAIKKAGYGLKNLVSELSPEEQAKIAEMDKNDKENGLAGTGGNIAGNLLTSAAPGGLLASGFRRLLGAGAQILPRTAAVLNTGATSAGTTALLSPGQGETHDEQLADKGKQAGVSGLLGAAIQAPISVLTRTLTGAFRPSADTRHLMDEQVYPTLQQGADSMFGRFVGGLTSEPAGVRQRQAGELLDAVTRRATNGATDMHGLPLRDRVDRLTQGLTSQGDVASRNRTIRVDQPMRDRILDSGSTVQSTTGGFSNEAGQVTNRLDNILGQTDARLQSGTYARDVLNPISDAAAASTGRVRQGLEEGYGRALDHRNRRLSWQQQREMEDIDRRQYDLARLRAALTGTDQGALPSAEVSALARAFERAPTAHTAGNTTQRDLVDPAMRVIGDTGATHDSRSLMAALRRLGGVGLAGGLASTTGAVSLPFVGGLTAAGAGTSAAGMTRPGARFLGRP